MIRQIVAEAKMARAGFLSGGRRVDPDKGTGFGMGASLRALEASEHAASQRTESARDDAAHCRP